MISTVTRIRRNINTVAPRFERSDLGRPSGLDAARSEYTLKSKSTILRQYFGNTHYCTEKVEKGKK